VFTIIMFRSELYGLTNELVFGFSNIYIYIFMLLILHRKMLTTTSANKILFRSFGESTDRRSGRRGGLMVNTLDSGSSDPGSSPGRVHIALCSWARHWPLTVPLSTQVYKWVPANLIHGVAPRRTSIPSRGE